MTPLSPEDVADILEGVRVSYTAPGSAHVVVVDGFGVRVGVERGALEVLDGIGQDRRTRRFEVTTPPERVVVAGEGAFTTQALAWCHSQGTAVVVISRNDVLLAASPPGRNDPRVRRAQALALGAPAGLAVVRHLLGAKLAGQAKVLRDIFGDLSTAETVSDLADGVAVALDVDEARQLEAAAAAAYFSAWAGHPATAVRFVAKDRRRVPPHWGVFDSRRSAITGATNTNRLAERPINALLNLTYKLAEVEARFALVRLGLDPGLGVLHLDAAGRDSLALDVLEPVRPAVDHFVLDLAAERSFLKRDFAERPDGAVRVMPPLAHELTAMMPTWRRAVAPHAERVAHIFADQVAGRLTVTTPLTGAKGKASQEAVRRRKAVEARERADLAHATYRSSKAVRRPAPADPERAATLFATCVDCGGPLARSRHVRCPSCWEKQPAQSREARRRRGRSIAMARSELERWKADNPHANADPADFAPLREALSGLRLATIMASCQVSKTTASGWRSGRHVPALRHWPALANLVGLDVAGLRSQSASQRPIGTTCP
jgi:CRISPR-associated protein Cas1